MTNKILFEAIKDSLGTHLWRKGLILAILTAFCLPLSAPAYNFQGCDACHGASLAGDNSRFNLHPPFAQQECGACHAAKTVTAVPEKAVGKSTPAGRADRRKINWLGDSVMAYTSHAFLLPNDKLEDNLIVELRGGDGKFSRQEIAVPALSSLAQLEDGGQPPVISDLQVLKVLRGVFLSVTIGWKTDTLADALVHYGEKDLSQTSEPSKHLGREHQVVLYNLKPDRTYRFTAVSSDRFGHSQVSAPATFSTSNPFTASPPDIPGNLPGSGDQADIGSHFKRLGNDYLLELILKQPATVYVGSRKAPQKSKPPVQTAKATKQVEDEYHAGLNGERVISLKICRSCHQDQSVATHPVNVYPKPGMTIPPEYPTLADGRITCASCHNSHGSDYDYLSRKSGRRELCVGCHKDML